jgi:hypothetical protein
LTWGLLNCGFLLLLRRPAVAAALSLALLTVLILLSQFKHDVLLMTVNFVDLMIIDADTFAFLMNIFPQLGVKVAIGVAFGLIALGLVWYFDPRRMRRRHALGGAVACLGGLVALSLAVPNDPWEEFYAENYVSKFARSGVTGDRRSDHARRDGIRRQRERAAGRRRCRQGLHGAQAAAHRDGVRRVELRCARAPGREGAGRLRRAFSLR